MQRAFDERKILDELSPALRQSALLWRGHSLLRNVPFFSNLGAGFLAQILECVPT